MCTTWPGWSNSSSGWSHKLSPSCILSFSSSYSQLQGSPTSEQPLAHCKTITEKINKCTCLCLCIVKEYFSRSFYQGAERPPVQWCYVWEDLSLCQGKILLPSNWYSLITEGRLTLPKRMNFRKSSKRPLSPPSFSESYIADFVTKLRQKCVWSYGGTFVYYIILFPMRCM